MHEYPITQQIIHIAEKKAAESGATKVITISLVVGDQSGFIGDSIQMYFDVISEGTMCDGATLHLKHIKPKMFCESCHTHFTRKPFSFACPDCGKDGIPTDIGKEFYIEHIEVLQSD